MKDWNMDIITLLSSIPNEKLIFFTVIASMIFTYNVIKLVVIAIKNNSNN